MRSTAVFARGLWRGGAALALVVSLCLGAPAAARPAVQPAADPGGGLVEVNIGNGNPAGCTETALDAALAQAGPGLNLVITIDCGSNPHTIDLTATKTITQPVTIFALDQPDPFSAPLTGLVTLRMTAVGRLFTVLGLPGVYSGTLQAVGVNLTGGNGVPYGGCIVATGAPVSLYDGRLYNCRTDVGSGGYGGALRSDNHVSLSNMQVEDNVADISGALDIAGTLYVDGTTFRNNQALAGTGGAVTAGGETYFENTQFISNSARLGGGAFVATNVATVTLRLGQVLSNTSYSPSGNNYGGGIINDGRLVITDTLISHNVLTGSVVAGDEGGGGIANYPGALLRLLNVTLADNRTAGQGGAIENWDEVHITDSRLLDNWAARGGGLAYRDAQAFGLIAATVVAGNHASDRGGGLYGALGGYVTLNYTQVTGNQAIDGGGLFTEQAGTSVTAYYSSISDNHAISAGGGINMFDGTVVLDGSAVTGNTAGNGAGIYQLGALRLINTTVSGNIGSPSGGIGGGLYVVDGPALLRHVTLFGNSAANGGGLYVLNSSGVTVTLTNTVIANSPLGGNCKGAAVNSSRYSRSSDLTCALGGPGDANNQDPQLVALANNGGPTLSHYLLPTSPLINAIVGSDCENLDQRGAHRPFGASCDIGAIEFGAEVAQVRIPLVIR